VTDPNRALFESVLDLLAPVLDELVFVGGCSNRDLAEALAGFLRPDAGSQARRPILEQRLAALAR
jgi:hypothetical protein